MELPALRITAMRISRLAAAFLAAAGLSVSAAQPAGPSATEVASALQKKYDSIRDFSADFEHHSEGGILRKKRLERGLVLVKKPGRMRWNYTSPEKKEFVSDGKHMYLYVPADRQVVRSPVPEADQATTAVLFLAGKGSLTRDFNVSFAADGGSDTYALRLQPKLKERDYDWLEVVVNRTTMQIRSLSAADAQGGRSTFVFSNFKENPGLSDKTFEFKIPRGVDVVPAGNSR